MNQPTGPIVKDWAEFGHHFQIEQLLEPVRKGAGTRPYRLWDNGSPCLGHQWCYTIESAEKAAGYMLECSYVRRIEYLEQWVARLEGRIAALTS